MKRRTYSFLLILATVAFLGACSSSGGGGSDDSGSSDGAGDDSGSSDGAGDDSGSSDGAGDDSGSSDGGSTDGGVSSSTAAIAGLWELPADTALGLDIAEISTDGVWISWTENTFDNCYNFDEGTLENQGNNNYKFPITDSDFLIYTFVNQGDSLNFIYPTLNVNESWTALEGVSTSDFNLCP